MGDDVSAASDEYEDGERGGGGVEEFVGERVVLGVGFGGDAGESGDGGDGDEHGDDGEVLEDEEGEGEAACCAAELAPLLVEAHDDGGGGEGEGHRDEQCGGGRGAEEGGLRAR